MSSSTIPAVVPPLPKQHTWKRSVSASDPLRWLAAGWRDCLVQPATSFGYGLLVFLVSITALLGLLSFEWDYIVLPAFAGFVVVGPLVAVGLYEKSRRIASGHPPDLVHMLLVRPESGAQLLFAGVLLSILVALWIRAAVIVYALFFGMRPFPGLEHLAATLFLTDTGWAMLAVGSAVGGVFAAFAFAISAFSIPMLLDKRVDALTAMGSSLALVTNNLSTMLLWAALVAGLFLLCVATGFVGMIIVFPLLGHATWHAYRAVMQ